MAQNITLLGASYSAVPAVTLPKTGGGTARFTDVTPTTAGDADVASGKVYFKSDGTQSTGTASGGGGASNVVTGTFTGTTTGAAMDVTLNYSGSGYPIVVVIYPTEGPYNSLSGPFYNLVQQYATNIWISVKTQADTAPTYSNTTTTNNAVSLQYYKSSSTRSYNYNTAASTNANVYRNGNTSSGTNTIVRFKSATKMSVFIASTSYGFAANIEYKYWVLYSS